MKILGIETSCDETSAAVVEGNQDDKNVKLLSNIVTSSLKLHAKTGGIIPEAAAREQILYIIPVINKALGKIPLKQLDAIAVTIGPGLIGSLLVGIETAKALAYVWKKPIIPVNHLIGHIYANFISENSKLDAKRYQLDADIQFPAIALIVSGGHTDLVLIKNHRDIKWLGGTRDDAAGEALDKIGRLLRLPYPGGPAIEQSAMEFKIKNLKLKIKLPRPLIKEETFDFSFSGLKTATLREVEQLKKTKQFNNTAIQQLSHEVQQAIIDVLVKKTMDAALQHKAKSVLLCGGVSANQKLREEMQEAIDSQLSTLNSQLFTPPAQLCTDNAAMIASAAFFNYKPVPWKRITADPELYFV